jgi:hypothetical protein
MNDSRTSTGSPRGTGPWPGSNDERSVRVWFKSRISNGIEEEERDPVVGLCLEVVSRMGKGERLMNNYRFPESEIDKLAVMADRVSKGILMVTIIQLMRESLFQDRKQKNWFSLL